MKKNLSNEMFFGICKHYGIKLYSETETEECPTRYIRADTLADDKAVRDALIELGWTPPPALGPLPGPKLPTRSPISLKVKSLKVNESFTVATQAEAHRWRVYISREYGAGSGAYRAIDGHYRVWRTK